MTTGEAAAWTGAIATLLAVLVALFKDDITRFWRRPKLKATIRLTAPDCHKTQMRFIDKTAVQQMGRVDCYYLRIWVENEGSIPAERVQVFVNKLLRQHADGTFQVVKSFVPMNLCWAHSRRPTGERLIFAEAISPHMGKHCDLGHITDPEFKALLGESLSSDPRQKEAIIALDLEVIPNTQSHLIPPGIYRLELKLAAANAKPTPKTLEINLTGRWYADEEKMFADGIGIKEIT